MTVFIAVEMSPQNRCKEQNFWFNLPYFNFPYLDKAFSIEKLQQS